MTRTGADVVTTSLELHYGARSVTVSRSPRGLMEWIVRRPVDRDFSVVLTDDALLAGQYRIERWLDVIRDDAMCDAPVPPAYYHVSPHRISVRGMREVRFETYGQRIRCRIEQGPLGGRNGSPSGEGERWRVELDGVDVGPLMPAEPSDSREDVTERAVALLKASNDLRVPDPPWQWSILDASGTEWWGRITPPWDPEDADDPVRQLVLRSVPTGRERRLVWDDPARKPSAEELQRLL
ncbi:MAG: hypothetical protein PVH00_15620 [Gemmatimonadota bacterium]|jgi:hypothetical protein